MMIALYKTKKLLKASIGQRLRHEETGIHGQEYRSTGTCSVVGPSCYERRWYANVQMKDDKIVRVT